MTVEEQAVFTCRNAAGQIGVVETGYLYPSTAEDQRDFAFSISHTSSYVRGYADQLYIKARGQQQRRATKVEYNTDEFYSVFLKRSWADLANGCPPVAGLREAEHAIAVVEAGYRSVANGGAPEPVDNAFQDRCRLTALPAATPCDELLCESNFNADLNSAAKGPLFAACGRPHHARPPSPLDICPS
ncbi:hypothetical protein HDG34_007203 [Paraburkholderia sp. HC6.4b]|uniref:hypothetical protein n=1 Tax=unclassified Paraburkholderia TaxID=2615204 RepID=UPI0016216341|nr:MULTISPECIES: hypothetical protein [unclassified Paraburkholderia]MBB5413225.1 hypothetical protein [Paraburkholderia sp. HC6.4b]MBB5455506.1 hypothetical protein [Paraburkholderia sp. Kb1A]